MKKFHSGWTVNGRILKSLFGESGGPAVYHLPVQRFQPPRQVYEIFLDSSETDKRVMDNFHAKELLSCLSSSMSFYFFYVGASVAQTRIDEEGCGAFFAAAKEFRV